MVNKKTINELIKAVEDWGRRIETLKLECEQAGKHLKIKYFDTDPHVMYYQDRVDGICLHCHTSAPRPLNSDDLIKLAKYKEDHQKMLQIQYTI